MVPFTPEAVEHDAARQDAIEAVQYGDQTFGTGDRSPAHAPDADSRAGPDDMAQLVGRPLIVIWRAALQDRHEPVRNAALAGPAMGFIEGADGAGDAVQDFIAIVGDLGFAAIIGRGKQAERIGLRQIEVALDRPGIAAIGRKAR